jgi:hypothetical protein
MEGPKENIQPKQEVVYINKAFQIFKPERTYPELRGTNNQRVGYGSNVILEIDQDAGKTKIPFRFYTQRGTASRTNVITPFNPELGVNVDMRDLSKYLRKEKVLSLKDEDKEAPKDIFHPLAPGSLHVDGRTTEVMKNPETGEQELPKDSSLNSLRLVLKFPNGISLESSPEIPQIFKNRMDFYKFYPTDFGKLAGMTTEEIIKEKNAFFEGLFLFLPDDPQLLSQINATFALLH